MNWTSFEQLDRVRRMQGATLDVIGLGPLEAPHTVVYRESGVALRRYDGPAAGPIVLIVPAPIKRPYVWDLAPDVSVVRRVAEILDRWLDPQHRYFKVKADDGRRFILRHDAASNAWELAALIGEERGTS